MGWFELFCHVCLFHSQLDSPWVVLLLTSPKSPLIRGPTGPEAEDMAGRPASPPLLTGVSSILSCPGDTDWGSGPEKWPVDGALRPVTLFNFYQTFSIIQEWHWIHEKSSSIWARLKKKKNRTKGSSKCAVLIPGRPSQGQLVLRAAEGQRASSATGDRPLHLITALKFLNVGMNLNNLWIQCSSFLKSSFESWHEHAAVVFIGRPLRPRRWYYIQILSNTIFVTLYIAVK